VKASISVSSAAQYRNNERMQTLVNQVRQTAEQISRELGWDAPPSRK
jgi:DNA-binding IclR family transcriptional regulator